MREDRTLDALQSAHRVVWRNVADGETAAGESPALRGLRGTLDSAVGRLELDLALRAEGLLPPALNGTSQAVGAGVGIGLVIGLLIGRR